MKPLTAFPTDISKIWLVYHLLHIQLQVALANPFVQYNSKGKILARVVGSAILFMKFLLVFLLVLITMVFCETTYTVIKRKYTQTYSQK